MCKSDVIRSGCQAPIDLMLACQFEWPWEVVRIKPNGYPRVPSFGYVGGPARCSPRMPIPINNPARNKIETMVLVYSITIGPRELPLPGFARSRGLAQYPLTD